VRYESVKKVFEPQDTVPSDFMERLFAKETTLDDFLSIVPLLGNQLAYHAGGFHSAPSFETNGALSRGVTGYTSGSSIRFMISDASVTLTEDKIAMLKEIWSITKSARINKKQKRVVNAMKRLYYADTRQKSEDKLIDCMIAAESLYLDDDKNELSYRLALNAAIWDEDKSMNKEDVYALFKKAYTLRSKIVHGSSADIEEVGDVVNKVKTVLQSAVVKAFQGLRNNTFPPKWTEKLLK
jgi:predicted nucleic acid-binding protein